MTYDFKSSVRSDVSCIIQWSYEARKCIEAQNPYKAYCLLQNITDTAQAAKNSIDRKEGEK